QPLVQGLFNLAWLQDTRGWFRGFNVIIGSVTHALQCQSVGKGCDKSNAQGAGFTENEASSMGLQFVPFNARHLTIAFAASGMGPLTAFAVEETAPPMRRGSEPSNV